MIVKSWSFRRQMLSSTSCGALLGSSKISTFSTACEPTWVVLCACHHIGHCQFQLLFPIDRGCISTLSLNQLPEQITRLESVTVYLRVDLYRGNGTILPFKEQWKSRTHEASHSSSTTVQIGKRCEPFQIEQMKYQDISDRRCSSSVRLASLGARHRCNDSAFLNQSQTRQLLTIYTFKLLDLRQEVKSHSGRLAICDYKGHWPNHDSRQANNQSFSTTSLDLTNLIWSFSLLRWTRVIRRLTWRYTKHRTAHKVPHPRNRQPVNLHPTWKDWCVILRNRLYKYSAWLSSPDLGRRTSS